MIDEKRDDIQNLAVEAFLKLKDLNGTANIATGTGKTFIFIKICKALFGNKLLKIKPNVLFLAETTQREIDLVGATKVELQIIVYFCIFFGRIVILEIINIKI